jgi:3-dehydroquinate synthetase
MAMDKKVANGQLNLVLLQGELGKCVITNKFDAIKLDEVVSEYCLIK